jgi:hypothetical protein
MPRHTINIRQYLNPNGQRDATSISAKINFNSDNFFFTENTPENDTGIDDCNGSNGCVAAEWFVSTPGVEDNYTFYVEWEYIHEDYHYEVSDNFTIEVAYDVFPYSGPVDARMTEPAYLLLLIIAYGLFLAGLFARVDPHTKITIIMLAMLFLMLTAIVSILFDNHAIGLLNFGLGVLMGALVIVHATEMLPNAGNP